MTKVKFLEDRLAAYFHEDWSVIFPTINDAVDAMVADVTREQITGMKLELTRLINGADEVTFSTLLSIGCYYDPRDDGRTPREWLTHLLRTIEEVNTDHQS